MNLKDYPRRRYSINQFTQPRCFELEGESFYFVMDDGYDYVLSILDDGVCELKIEGQTQKIENYTCLKADDETYLLFHETTIDGYRTCITYVIDMEQRLVTILTCKVGLNPKFPLIVSSHFDFGAIRIDGEELTFKRHSYTDDLIGTMVDGKVVPGCGPFGSFGKPVILDPEFVNTQPLHSLRRCRKENK